MWVTPRVVHNLNTGWMLCYLPWYCSQWKDYYPFNYCHYFKQMKNVFCKQPVIDDSFDTNFSFNDGCAGFYYHYCCWYFGDSVFSPFILPFHSLSHCEPQTANFNCLQAVEPAYRLSIGCWFCLVVVDTNTLFCLFNTTEWDHTHIISSFYDVKDELI